MIGANKLSIFLERPFLKLEEYKLFFLNDLRGFKEVFCLLL